MGAEPKLRPYQTAIIERVNQAVESGKRRILIPLPTGGGKTVVAAALINEATQHGRRTMFLAHRRELVQQAATRLFKVGIDAGIIQAGFHPRPQQPVQVASVQTLHCRAVRSREMDLPPADLIVVDEAHHAPARMYRQILDAYPTPVIIGLTATPMRGDGRGLGNIFQTLIPCASVRELIDGGYLVPAKFYAPSRPDLSGVKIDRGDYVEKQLAERVDQPKLIGDIVEHWHRLAGRRRTVVFATGVAHSVHLRDEFRRAGVVAEHIDGDTPAAERDGILRRLAAGNVELITNCSVLTEGWDQPEVSCLVLARPTKSMLLYRQMVGRVLRPAPGKDHALILDHAGAVFEHGFPDDPVEWSLSEDRRAENPAHNARSRDGMLGLVPCPECFAIRVQGQPCHECGWRPRPKAQAVEVADGELARVSKDRTASLITLDRYRFFCMLLGFAAEREYARGWALPETDQLRLDALIAEHRKVRAQLPTDERETLDRLTIRLRAALFNQPQQVNMFSTAQALMRSSGMRLAESESSALAAYVLDGIVSGDDSQSQLLAATQQMQETQMSFNLQYLQLQSQMQNENRSYAAVSNIMKTKHDTVKNSISNIR